MMNTHGAGGSGIAHTMRLAQMYARSQSRCSGCEKLKNSQFLKKYSSSS